MTAQLISSDIFQTWMSTINSSIVDIGDKTTLSTTDKTNLVAAINEVFSDIGDKTTLSTTDKTNLVAAINEVFNDIGDKTTLSTTDKTNLVAAINEVFSGISDIGDKTALLTTDKTNLVAAINEVFSDIGDKTTLSTTDKTNLVAAINEVFNDTLEIVSNKIQLKNKEINGGRGSSSESLESLTVTTYALPSTIQPFNSSIGVQYGIGKFIDDNSTNGGAAGALEPEISTFLVDIGRTELRYGTEYFLSTIEAGVGVGEVLVDGVDSYYAMTSNNMKYLGQIGDIITWCGWVKFVSVGDSPSLGKILIGNDTNVTTWIDNILVSGYSVIPSIGNWFHVRQQITLTKEYENIFPAIYGNYGTTTGDTIAIGLPSLFNGNIEITKEKHTGIFG